MPLSRPPRWLVDVGGESLVQGVRDPLGAIDGEAVALAPLATGDERLPHCQALGQLALGETVGDPQGDPQCVQLPLPLASGAGFTTRSR